MSNTGPESAVPPAASGGGGGRLRRPGAIAGEGRAMDDRELLEAIREHAYLEGDFVLRSGRKSRYYLDKYRFETRPELLEALADRIAARVSEVEPDAVRLAGPELGAVALAAATSLRSGLPFLIVRKAEKGYGTGNLLEGGFEAGDRVCLIEDVVTSGGAAAEAVHECGRFSRRARSQGLQKARKRRMVERIRCACYAPQRP